MLDKTKTLGEERMLVRIVFKLVVSLVILAFVGLANSENWGWYFPAVGVVAILAVWRWRPKEE